MYLVTVADACQDWAYTAYLEPGPRSHFSRTASSSRALHRRLPTIRGAGDVQLCTGNLAGLTRPRRRHAALFVPATGPERPDLRA